MSLKLPISFVRDFSSVFEGNLLKKGENDRQVASSIIGELHEPPQKLQPLERVFNSQENRKSVISLKVPTSFVRDFSREKNLKLCEALLN